MILSRNIADRQWEVNIYRSKSQNCISWKKRENKENLLLGTSAFLGLRGKESQELGVYGGCAGLARLLDGQKLRFSLPELSASVALIAQPVLSYALGDDQLVLRSMRRPCLLVGIQRYLHTSTELGPQADGRSN